MRQAERFALHTQFSGVITRIGGRAISIALAQESLLLGGAMSVERCARLVVLIFLASVCAEYAPGQQDESAESVRSRATRAEMTGRQLFEHQWEWFEPAQRRVRRRRSTETAAAVGDFIAGDGLGPLHNAKSCVECHAGGGGSGVEHNVTLITIDPRSAVRKDKENGSKALIELFPGVLGPRGVLLFNTVVHDKSTRDGYDVIRAKLADHVPGGIKESWFDPEKRDIASIAERPVLAGRYGSVDYYLSQRNSPALYGLGDIDMISRDRLIGLARRQAKNSDGKITGRVAGKFGWQGQVSSLSEFVVGACVGELGLNQVAGGVGGLIATSQAPDPVDPGYVNLASDMSLTEVINLIAFVAKIPRPVERRDEGHTIGNVLDGEASFRRIGCQACHVSEIHPVTGLFSDLLLHDMGEELQAPSPAPIAGLVDVKRLNAPRFDLEDPRRGNSSGAAYYRSPSPSFPVPYPLAKPASPRFPRGDVPESIATTSVGTSVTWDTLQREWRTPPLWGVRDTAPYLHDGRAATLEEAIQWHGGEAESSRRAYMKLSRAEKDLILAFLSSLRAPELSP